MAGLGSSREVETGRDISSHDDPPFRESNIEL